MIRTKKIIFRRGIILFGWFLCACLLFSQEPDLVKIKIVVDSAPLKVAPQIDAETLARMPLNTLLDAQEKQGEWYKVFFEKEGLRIEGFIHEMLVNEMSADELAEEQEFAPAIPIKTQAELIEEIETRMEENRQLIRQEKDYEKAINSLSPLTAKTFRIEDIQRQRELAAEIFLWMGMAQVGQGDEYKALLEIRSMFEVDHAYGKEITRNIYDPQIVGLIEQAEKEYLGLITGYNLALTSEPAQARVKINGEDIGLTPLQYTSDSPRVSLEIEKKSYKTVKEELFLDQEDTEMQYVLEILGRNLDIRSTPSGAKVFLDGKDTGRLTNCKLPYVSFGTHEVKVIKENYAEWTQTVEVSEKQEQEPLSIEAGLTGKNYVFFKKWGSPHTQLFHNPLDLALDKNNNVYVIDESQERITKITPDGKIDRGWVSDKRNLKDLKSPAGIAVDSQGYIYVTDTKKHCVMKFDNRGRFIKKWGKEGQGNLEFQSPLGITVDNDNNVYVADSQNHCIKKFSHLGKFQKLWGKRGLLDGEFISPAAVAVNPKNEIYISDKTRIQKYSSEGEHLASWGSLGKNDAEFNTPMGIFIDPNGYIYAADSGNNRIQKFDAQGRFISKWGSSGRADGQLNYPTGIGVDSRGYVYVVEKGNNRIQVFCVPEPKEDK
jgi:DNA-binding beta-propeller fold protein YncE